MKLPERGLSSRIKSDIENKGEKQGDRRRVRKKGRSACLLVWQDMTEASRGSAGVRP